jgi:hypothetical protein
VLLITICCLCCVRSAGDVLISVLAQVLVAQRFLLAACFNQR